jgi:hypothetical protein
MTMAEVVYAVSSLLSLGCAALLLRAYLRTRSRLLLWSSLSFILFATNNVVLFVDYVILPDIDINGPLLRDIIAAGAGMTMLFGLIWEVA